MSLNNVIHQCIDYNANLYSYFEPDSFFFQKRLKLIASYLLSSIKNLNFSRERILTKSNSVDGIILNCSSKTALLQCVTSMSFILRIMSPFLFSCKSKTGYFPNITGSSVSKIQRKSDRARHLVIKRLRTSWR